MNTENSYKVKLPTFEGPLDLLLHLIKQHEVDIYDIPILKITEQYLGYLQIMTELNLDIAGEFLVMAATLTQIKSRMLLPKSEYDSTDEEEDEADDPKAELVRRLVEYKTYKDAADFLRESELKNKEIFSRQPEKGNSGEDEIFVDVSIFDLMWAYNSIVDKIGGSDSQEVMLDEISVTEKLNYIMDVLSGAPHLRFEDLFVTAVSRIEIVGTFLALLELMKIKLIRTQQSQRFASIFIYSAVEERSNGYSNGEINN